MSETRETRLFMISPDSMLTPDQLVRMVHAMGLEATVKETCYGCLVEGPRETVRRALDGVRKDHEYEVFSKVRAYPSSDPRRCRAQHGTRPGYAQLEAEWELLPLIQHALVSAEAGRPFKQPVEAKQFPVEDFKKMCEASR